MRNRLLVAASLLLGGFFPRDASAGEGAPASSKSIAYLCIGKHTTGFKFDKKLKDWEPANFKSGTKYILKRNSDRWEWSEFAQANGSECDSPNKSGFIECSDRFINIIVNTHTQRYTLISRHGYVQYPTEKIVSGSTLPEGSQAPYIEIGECSKIVE